MESDRLTAFTDGVVAIIITIMVLELKVPHGVTMDSLAELAPVFLSYVMSFIYVGIYWNNHHHYFQLVGAVNGAMLWANLHLLFWLSIIPFTTGWMGENHFAALPTALYGFSLLMAALAFLLMQSVIIAGQGLDSPLRAALGRDLKGWLSPVAYVVGIGLSFFNTTAAIGVYLAVALTWLIPDRRVARHVAVSKGET